MSEPVWLNRAECLAIHEMMLARFGGLTGLREESMFESALAKPRNRFAYGAPSLAELAASYAAGIVHNHPFLDGNKRTGFMLAAVFLESNGGKFVASDQEVVEKTLALAAGSLDEAGYAAWLERNCEWT